MDIGYAAHTESCVFMLDEEGVCRWVVSRGNRGRAPIATGRSERFIGAQYVASLDLTSTGGLTEWPRVGCPMLFAYTGDNGRITLLRSDPLMRFEDRRQAPSMAPPALSPAAPVVRHGFSARTPIPPLPRSPASVSGRMPSFDTFDAVPQERSYTPAERPSPSTMRPRFSSEDESTALYQRTTPGESGLSPAHRVIAPRRGPLPPRSQPRPMGVGDPRPIPNHALNGHSVPPPLPNRKKMGR